MGTFKNLLSIQSLKIPFIGFVIVPVMCIIINFQVLPLVDGQKASRQDDFNATSGSNWQLTISLTLLSQMGPVWQKAMDQYKKKAKQDLMFHNGTFYNWHLVPLIQYSSQNFEA